MATDGSTVATADDQPPTETADQNDVVENDHEGSPKKLKLEEGAASDKKRRGSSVKQKQDDKVMAEAKAFYGDLDLSEGRRLRRRMETPKAEEKMAATPRRNARKKQSGEEDKKSTEERNTEDELSPANGSSGAAARDSEQQPGAEDSPSTQDKEQEKEEGTGDVAAGSTEDKAVSDDAETTLA